MNWRIYRKLGLLVLFASCLYFTSPSHSQERSAQTFPVQYIDVDELKTHMDQASVTILDVRGSYVGESENKIKGAIHVKVRKLKSRLQLPPLKDIPKNREIVTYCACPNDEASIRAAQVLTESGFKNVRVLKGGWAAWKRSKGPIEAIAR
jgi:rhodanese-related sulfurtransferase